MSSHFDHCKTALKERNSDNKRILEKEKNKALLQNIITKI